MQSRNRPEENAEKKKHLDLYFLLSIIDIRDVFWPITPFKIMTWTAYLGMIAGMVYLQHFEEMFNKISDGIHANILPLMIALYIFEPLLMLTTMLFTSYPVLQQPLPVMQMETVKDIEQGISNEPEIVVPEENLEMAIIIPCHNSENLIAATLRACLKIVGPEQIFVIDNGDSETPPDKTPDIVRQISPRINYHWHHQGNKNIAQFIGASLAAKYRYCLGIDHDVHPPANFRLATHLLTGNFKGLMYPIRAMHEYGENSILISWQDLEYQISDHFKMFEDRFHGALFPHGAVCAWKRKAWMKVLRRHNTRFIAEDVQIGLESEQLGYRKHIDMRYYFHTVAPHTLIGTALNLYQQRVRGWSIGIQTLNYQLARGFVTEWTWPPSDLAALKVSQFYAIYNNIVDWLRLMIMGMSANTPLYWAKFGAIIGGQQLVLLIWHYIKLRNRPDLQQGVLPVFTMFIYRMMQLGFTTLGLARLLTSYLPNLRSVKSIAELEKNGEFREILKLLEKAPEPVPDAKEENRPVLLTQISSAFFKPAAEQPLSQTAEPQASAAEYRGNP